MEVGGTEESGGNDEKGTPPPPSVGGGGGGGFTDSLTFISQCYYLNGWYVGREGIWLVIINLFIQKGDSSGSFGSSVTESPCSQNLQIAAT